MPKADFSAFPRSSSIIPSSIISCDNPKALASLNALPINTLIVSFIGYALFTARLNAPEAAFCMSDANFSSSISRTLGLNMSPFSYTAVTLRPTSIGSIPSLVNTSAAFADIISPSLTAVESSLIATLPSSTPDLIPNIASSPITGPGKNVVGPFGTIISKGAV